MSYEHDLRNLQLQSKCEDPNGQSGCNRDCLGTEGCTCPAGFLMQGSDCIRAMDAGVSWQRPTWLYQDARMFMAGIHDGVYSIMPTGWPGSPFNVHCRMHGDEGWTVFQRRTDDGISFYQNWDAYRDGFGNNINFWLGNEKYIPDQSGRLQTTT
ncbi:putative angiopoietin-related protein 4 [Apostichopus japonicus]|uniref:Putative angiopoietin-related protein 4 n=1 Tax=Stichopus japonicus TaxID=307972 RepID=A0A2G8LHK7_STIJA|nr:putative angiopoietin-related protein 4 [Apostichopus japonicus]